MRKPDRVVARITTEQVVIIVRRGGICARRRWVPANRSEGRWRQVDPAAWQASLAEERDSDLVTALDDIENSAFSVAEGLA